MDAERVLHPDVTNVEVRLAGGEELCLDGGGNSFLREGLLRRVGHKELLLTWTTGGVTEPSNGNVTRIARSVDDGRTWEEAGLFRHPQRGLFTTELFCPRDGEVHAFVNTYDFGVWMTQLLSYRAISRDGGRTWEGPHSIPGGMQGVWPNRGVVLSSGRWVIPVAWAELIGEQWAEPSHGQPAVRGQVGGRALQQTVVPFGASLQHRYGQGNAWADAQHRYVCGVMVSDDEGSTFRLCGYIRGGLHGLLMEPQVVELDRDHVVMLIRSQREGWLLRSDSHDGGQTWGAIVRTDIPNPSAKINVLKAADGRIFLIHNPTGHQGAIMGGRNPLSLWVSEDNMETWSIKADLVKDLRRNVSLNYPSGYLDESAQEVVFCWEDVKHIYMMRVPMGVGSLTLRTD